MKNLATLQIIWPPIPSMIFVSLFDWLAGFQSMTVTAGAFVVYVYVVFLPGLIEVLRPKKGDA